MKIYGPNNASLTINCSELFDANIFAESSTQLHIDVVDYGFLRYRESLLFSTIYTPTNNDFPNTFITCNSEDSACGPGNQVYSKYGFANVIWINQRVWSISDGYNANEMYCGVSYQSSCRSRSFISHLGSIDSSGELVVAYNCESSSPCYSDMNWLNTQSNKVPEYVLSNVSLNFTGAQEYCQQHYGRNLISIHDELQHYYAKEASSGTSVWIGLTRPIDNDGSDWQWLDGSSFDYGTDTSGGEFPWGSGEPNNAVSTEHCVEMRSNDKYEWNDATCSLQRRFICQPETDSPTAAPSVTPSFSPSSNPTNHPSANPTQIPSTVPTTSPSINPTSMPSTNPTSALLKPTLTIPTIVAQPTLQRTIQPTKQQNPTKIATNYIISFSSNANVNETNIQIVFEDVLLAYPDVTIIGIIIGSNSDVIIYIESANPTLSMTPVKEDLEREWREEYDEDIEVNIVQNGHTNEKIEENKSSDWHLLIIVIGISVLFIFVIVSIYFYASRKGKKLNEESQETETNIKTHGNTKGNNEIFAITPQSYRVTDNFIELQQPHYKETAGKSMIENIVNIDNVTHTSEQIEGQTQTKHDNKTEDEGDELYILKSQHTTPGTDPGPAAVGDDI